jgi:hypothetical protein
MSVWRGGRRVGVGERGGWGRGRTNRISGEEIITIVELWKLTSRLKGEDRKKGRRNTEMGVDVISSTCDLKSKGKERGPAEKGWRAETQSL